MRGSKKWIGVTMAAVITGSMAVPVMASGSSEPTEPEAENTQLKVGYTEASTYTLSIPAEVTLTEENEVTETISLSAVNVSTTQKVQIKVNSGISDGKVTLTDEADSDNKQYSTVSLVSGGAGIEDNAVVAEFVGTSTAPTTGGTLYFSALGEVPAGTYSGTITFTAGIVAK